MNARPPPPSGALAFVARARLARAGLAGAVTLWLCVALAAAPSGVAAASGAGGAGVTGGAPAAPLSVADDIEARLRGQPERAVAALRERLPQLAPADRVQPQLLLGTLLLTVGDPPGAEAAAVALDTLGPPGGSPLAPAAAALLRVRIAARSAPASRTERLMQEAQALLPAQAPPWLQIRFHEAWSRLREGQGKYDLAIAASQKAMVLADRHAPPWKRADVRASLAYQLVLAQQPEAAQRLLQEAERIAQASGDAVVQTSVVVTQSILAAELKQDAEELRLSLLAIDLARHAQDRRQEIIAVANLADYFLKRHEYATALALAQQALPLARELRDRSAESVALTNSGLALIALGRHAEGQQLVRQALALEETVGAMGEMLQIQEELGHALERAGLLAEAWQALTEHRRLADEVFQRQHQQAVLEVQEGFEADRRQRAMRALQTEAALKDAEITQQSLQQRLWVSGLLAGALMLTLVGLLLRRVHSSNAQLQSSNAQLKVASERDPLTGLANRRHLLAVMEQTAAAGQGFDGSMMLIDIDHFKRINDSHGHATGDAVLVEVARRLRSALREHDLVVRWGGEEFLVVLRDASPDEVETLAQRLLAAIGREPVALERGALNVTASIGFATFPLQPRRLQLGWERAIDLVDTAMYLAKAHGRNRAYGVRALEPEDGAAQGTSQPNQLEAAWRNGRAELAHLSGPEAPPPRAVPEVSP